MQITLKGARHNAGLKQTDVACSVGVDRKTVGSWEAGKTMPTADKIDALCALFGVTYDDIKWKA